MKRILLFALAGIALAGPLPAQERLAERDLRLLVDEGKRILSGSRLADGSYDQEALERKFQRLIHQFDAFIHEHDEFAAGYVAYAHLLAQIGQSPAARAMYMKANQLDPNIPLVKNQLGNFLAEEEDFAGALPYFLSAVELEPEEPLYHYQIGNLLHEFRDGFLEEKIFDRTTLDAKMLEGFATAARLAPNEIDFTDRYAEAFYDLEKPQCDKALDVWQKIEQGTTSAIEKQTVYLHQANIRLKQNQPLEARKLLAKVDQPLLSRQKEKLLAEIAEKDDADSAPGD